jgi:hypothetical protein
MAGDARGQWKVNQVIGHYKLLWPFSGDVGGAWQVYAARHVDTGAPALLVRPKKDSVWTPQKNWQGRVCAYTEPPCLVLDVDRLPDLHTLPGATDDLDVLTTVGECLQFRREAAEHLCSQPRKRHAREREEVEEPPAEAKRAEVSAAPTPAATELGAGTTPAQENPVAAPEVEQSSPRSVRSASLRAQRPYWAALAVASLATLVLVPRTLHEQPTPEAGTGGAALVGLAEEALAAPELLPVESLDKNVKLRSVVGLDMPPRPFKGQHLAPCGKLAREIQMRDGSRACWIKIDATAEVCKTEGYEWKGGCYLPSIPSQREPSSVLPRIPPSPAERAQ